MPDTTFLHIQTRDNATLRVQELSGVSARIGRAAPCEVRLPDAGLADVQCLLRRRGRDWHVQPVGPAGLLTIDGRPVEHQRPLPVGVPLRVGEHWLTLRPSDRVVPAFGSYERPILVDPVPAPRADATPIAPEPLSTYHYDDPTRVVGFAPSVEAEPPSSWRSRDEGPDRLLRNRERERLWQAKIQAVGGACARGGGATGNRRGACAAGARLRARQASPHRTELRPLLALPGPAPLLPEVPGGWGGIGDAPARGLESPGASPTSPQPPDAADSGTCSACPEPVFVGSAVRTGPFPDGPHSGPYEKHGPGDAKQVHKGVPTLAATGSESGSEEGLLCVAAAVPAAPVRESGAAGTAAATQKETANLSSQEASAAALSELAPAPIDPPAPVAEPVPDTWFHPERVAESLWTASTPFVADTSQTSGWAWSRETPPSATERDDEVLWPSLRDILAQNAPTRCGPAPAPRPAFRPRARREPMPTVGQPPASWAVPTWLASSTMVVVCLVLGLVGLGLVGTWAWDDFAAAIVANHLLAGPNLPAKPIPLPDAPGNSWWRTTSRHLYLRAVAASRVSSDPDQEAQAQVLLDAVRAAGPLEPSVRLALASRGGPAIGLSRDVIALRKTGQELLTQGRLDAALRVYRAALVLVAGADPQRAATPTFLDDAEVRRFTLPHEDLAASLLTDLVKSGRLTLDAEAWARLLPAAPIVRLAAYRLLREQGDPAAARALEALRAAGSDDPTPGATGATAWAAQAEALALNGQWDEAADGYRQAVEAMPPGLIRRSWALNCAEIEGRRGRIDAMREAWEAARGDDPHDVVNIHLAEARQRHGGLPESSPGLAAPAASPGFRRDDQVLPAGLESSPLISDENEYQK